MIQPRGTFVLLLPIEYREKKVGNIVVPNHKDEFAEFEVLAIGPGNSMAGGARAETFDLKVGQRVLVNHKTPTRTQIGMELKDVGFVYHDKERGETYRMIEERYIVGILAEPA